jgi:transposase
MYRMEPRLLHTIQHRNAQAQADLAYIKTRQQLVECRSKLINYARSMVKGVGERIPSGGADTFHRRAREHMPEMLSKAMEPLIQTIEELTAKIQGLDKLLLKMSEKRYPETAYVMQIDGVGPVTGLAFVLTLEDPERFQKSRTVGAFLGMTPKRDQSGDKDKQLRITKAGNTYLRALLINCAQRIMGPFGKDCALRRYGERIAARGGKIAKKRAVVAVARKLAVVMHKLWRDQAEYVPFKHGKKHAA